MDVRVPSHEHESVNLAMTTEHPASTCASKADSRDFASWTLTTSGAVMNPA